MNTPDNQKKPPTEEENKKKRRRTWWIVTAIVFLMVLSTTIQTYIQQVTVPSPIAGNIVVFSLFNLNIILLVIIIILVFRNLIKLYFERKKKIIGYKFRTKLIIVFLLLSLIPSTLLSIVASGFITNSVDNWFSDQIEKPLKESLEVAQQYYSDTGKRAVFYAESTAGLVAKKNMLHKENNQYLKNTLRKKIISDGTDSIVIYDKWLKILETANNENIETNISNVYISEEDLKVALSGKNITSVSAVGEGDLISAMVPIKSITQKGKITGVMSVSYFIPKSLVKKTDSITKAFEEYRELKLLKNPIKASYIITFLMITLLILFSATWFGFYLAKGITVPIQELAEATESIAEGNLDFKIEVKADDEIGLLVKSFNKMTLELKLNKATIEKNSEDLKASNIELESRKGYIETVLENIATGVISIDKQGKTSMINRSALKILNISDSKDFIGMSYKEIFEKSHLSLVRSIIKSMNKQYGGNVEKQLQIMVSGRMVTLLTNTTRLRDITGKYLGMVVVFDDLTELIKTQKIAAWREVARGIAHEIKNPLTPIQLNTQRLRKKFFENAPDLSSIFDECTNTIITEVDGLKKMVNEFSKFARMPEPNPVPTSLHKVIDEVSLLYKGSSSEVKLKKDFDPAIDLLKIDAEQIKRVFINLIDNSIDAVNGEGEIQISTKFNSSLQTVNINFSDNGKGIPTENKNKIFIPYFSTKKSGSGLGLAIVNRIIADHDGSIKVRDNEPIGTKFDIELPA